MKSSYIVYGVICLYILGADIRTAAVVGLCERQGFLRECLQPKSHCNVAVAMPDTVHISPYHQLFQSSLRRCQSTTVDCFQIPAQ